MIKTWSNPEPKEQCSLFFLLSKFIYLLLKFRVPFIHKGSHYFYKEKLKGKSLIQQIKLT